MLRILSERLVDFKLTPEQEEACTGVRTAIDAEVEALKTRTIADSIMVLDEDGSCAVVIVETLSGDLIWGTLGEVGSMHDWYQLLGPEPTFKRRFVKLATLLSDLDRLLASV